jgi:beta-glucuronidase
MTQLWRPEEAEPAPLSRSPMPMLEKIPGFAGCTPWILCDFRSPRRQLPDIQDGWNLKGLISHEGEKKKTFAVLKSFYDAKAKAEMAK